MNDDCLKADISIVGILLSELKMIKKWSIHFPYLLRNQRKKNKNLTGHLV